MSVDDQLQPLVSEFIAHLSEERQLSVHTVNCYKRDLTALQKELANQGITDWRDVSAHHLRTYIGGGKRQGRSGKTLQRSLSATRTFFNYLAREGVCTQNPAMEFSSDFIIAYPGETEDDFNKTLSLIKKVKFINTY